MKRTQSTVGRRLVLTIVVILNVWATAALYFDLRIVSLRLPSALVYGAATVVLLGSDKKRWPIAICFCSFLCILAWWLSLKPSNDRTWQADVAQTAWAEINGDQVAIHNFRNCDYRTEGDYTPHWETRTYDLSKLRAVDLFLTHWGSPWIAHPIVSFDFGDEGHVAMSVETRKEVGKTYSSLRGFFRYYELIYVISDERDVVRLRANYRQNEDVYLFRTTATPQQGRLIFLDYLRRANQLRDHPEWFNALTNNCTTNISRHLADAGHRNFSRWDWRIVLNGRADEMLYQHGDLAGDLPFAELKNRALINPAARAADQASDFSNRIRDKRPGFEENKAP
ncbi:MAG TPA: DUF4105 domain-containing protein [Terriglobales bacterium]|nr:DUF4105 domain-containing protein [Terriglobales bacterium]